MEQSQMGIYLNAKEATVVRITSPYWIPEKPDWELVTSDSNATLVAIRETSIGRTARSTLTSKIL